MSADNSFLYSGSDYNKSPFPQLLKKHLALIEKSSESSAESKELRPSIKNKLRKKFKTSRTLSTKRKEVTRRKDLSISVEKIRQKICEDKKKTNLASNLEKLKALSNSNKLPPRLQTQVLGIAPAPPKERKSEEKKSVFTEEDFQKFEREYFTRW